MKLTKYAAKRAQQRGIPLDAVLLIALFGDVVRKDSGGIMMRLSEKTRSKLIQLLDKCRKKVLVTDKNYETIITTYAMSK